MPVFAVTTAKGASWDHARGIREQPFWDQHAAFADGLVDRGIIIFGGPVGGDAGEDIALLAVEAPDEGTLRSIFDADPWAVQQVFRIKDVRTWSLWLDGRSRHPLRHGGAVNSGGGRPRTAELLDLAPHPEGGWYRETWRSGQQFLPAGYPGPRAAATAIYFLLLPGEESRWHRVRSDETWLWHSGGPLLLLDGGPADLPARQPDVVPLGADLAAGQVPQHVIPGGHWQAARPAADSEVLVSCVVAPGFEFADFTLLPG